MFLKHKKHLRKLSKEKQVYILSGGNFIMRNLKHTAAAIAAVVMISSLAVSQADDFKRSYKAPSTLLSSNKSKTVVHETEKPKKSAEKVKVANPKKAEEELHEQYTEEEIQTIITQKSQAQEGYVILSAGVLSVKESPSENAPQIDALVPDKPVQIIESTEDWYKIRYDDNIVGYVSKSNITTNKEESELALKYYNNFRYGTIKTAGGTVNIRKGPSTDSEVLGELSNDAQIIICETEGEFTKVCYSEDYYDGYIVTSAIENADAWLPKDQLPVKKEEAAQRREQERLERERLEKERQEKERLEKERQEKERKEKERQEKERLERERQAAQAQSSQTQTTQAQATPAPKQTEAPKTEATAPASSKGQAIVNTAKKYLGIRYVYGGMSPSGFDCSGLVKYVLAENGISISRTAASQACEGTSVSYNNMQPGDLIFFAKGGYVHHVGIYVGGGQMIHAPQTGDVVKYSSITTDYRRKGFYCAKRVY